VHVTKSIEEWGLGRPSCATEQFRSRLIVSVKWSSSSFDAKTMFVYRYTSVTPSCDLRRLQIVDSRRSSQRDRRSCNRRLAVTSKHGSQRIAGFLHCTRNANRPTVLRLSSEFTATVRRLKKTDCDRARSTVVRCRSTFVVWSQYGPHGRSAVAIHSCDRRSSADRVQQQRDHGRSYCDHSLSCASADRQQTECAAIEKSPQEILNSSKFLGDL